MRAHAGATSLSALIRDPSHDERGIIVFAPKGATERTRQSHFLCGSKIRKSRDICQTGRACEHDASWA